MVEFANIANLGLNFGPALERAGASFGARQERELQAKKTKLREVDIEDALDLATDPDKDVQEQGLIRLASLQGPAVANSIRATLQRGDDNELAQAQLKTDKALKDVLGLQSIKDPGKRATAIRQLGEDPDISSEELNELVKLQNMTPDEQELELERDRISLSTVDDLVKERTERVKFERELATAKPTETFTPITDQSGNITGQRSSLTGKVVTDPRTVKPEAQTTLVRNLEAAGVDLSTPAGQAKLLQAINKPATKIDINQANEGLFKTPEGFMLLDRNDPTKGVTPIPGGPKDNKTGEQAAKVQMLRTAKKAFKGVEELVFDKEGNVNDLTLIAAAVNAPGTDGRKLRSRMEFGIQAITRGETGAAMPPEEVENTRTRFMPSPLDSKEIVQLKLELFKDFLDGSLKLIDPSGRFNAVRFQTELDKRSRKKKTADEPDFSTMSDEDLLKGF